MKAEVKPNDTVRQTGSTDTEGVVIQEEKRILMQQKPTTPQQERRQQASRQDHSEKQNKLADIVQQAQR